MYGQVAQEKIAGAYEGGPVNISNFSMLATKNILLRHPGLSSLGDTFLTEHTRSSFASTHCVVFQVLTPLS